MIPHGVPIYVALEPVDMRLGFERLGGLVRERMQSEPRTRALFAFVGKRGNSMKILSYGGSGVVLVHKKLDAVKFELPRATREGEQRNCGEAAEVARTRHGKIVQRNAAAAQAS